MPQPRLTVWYNTRCPVCDAGIDRQRNMLSSGGCVVGASLANLPDV
jgi:hypothetical protein